MVWQVIEQQKEVGVSFLVFLINELKSLVDVPFIALTATASQKTKVKIFELLELRALREIVEGPSKRNVCYAV